MRDKSVILGNRELFIKQVSLSTNPLYNTDHLMCILTPAAPDRDALTERFAWSNQTTSTVLANTSSLTLTPIEPITTGLMLDGPNAIREVICTVLNNSLYETYTDELKDF